MFAEQLAGDRIVEQQHSTTGFSSHPFSYGMGIYSHGCKQGCFQPPRPDGVAGADAELRGKWVLKREPALVDSSSPRHGDKASYYTAVCLETGEEEWMELEGNSNGESSVAFLERLRGRHGGRLGVIWDNAPAPLRQAQEGSSDAVTPGDPWPEPAAAGKSAGLQPGLQR